MYKSYNQLPPVLKTCTSNIFDKRVPSINELSCTPSFGRLPKSYLSTNVKQFKHVEDFHDLYQNQNVEVDDINNLIDNCNLRSKISQLREQLSQNLMLLTEQSRKVKQIEQITIKHVNFLNDIQFTHQKSMYFLYKEQQNKITIRKLEFK
ncbi:Hypothetical_protein [Hexamita inflata]|uniref:Hypothetical_protein n=1 Tax=Hexamita inflata TaxID=28002 RepID=A0AA86NH71_9EUKA|nr:Hypothetical protein HINF_LOCUS6621 [Hexamita inflata]